MAGYIDLRSCTAFHSFPLLHFHALPRHAGVGRMGTPGVLGRAGTLDLGWASAACWLTGATANEMQRGMGAKGIARCLIDCRQKWAALGCRLREPKRGATVGSLRRGPIASRHRPDDMALQTQPTPPTPTRSAATITRPAASFRLCSSRFCFALARSRFRPVVISFDLPGTLFPRSMAPCSGVTISKT